MLLYYYKVLLALLELDHLCIVRWYSTRVIIPTVSPSYR